MKNFSVKTADFDSLSISGEAPIVQSDLGTAPNQIPLNKDLGSLAYMNAPQIEDLNVDTLELREIAAEMSETAVDVFVYDTRKDSDGGAWRSRTQHTSWYNEELNTANRGGRREFPAVAVIVAEASKVTIYDGDDPDLSMWMVFEGDTYNMLACNATYPVSSISAKNGSIVYTNLGYGVGDVSLITDSSYVYRDGEPRGLSGAYKGFISTRNASAGFYGIQNRGFIVDEYVNDVAMTVLPNAPIDSDTGLPVPTIAVATDGGVSVIRDDGSVVDIGYGNSATAKTITYIEIDGDVIRFRNAGYQYNRFTIPDSDVSNYVNAPNFKQYSSYDVPSLIGESGDAATMSGAIGSDLGLSLLDENTNNFSSGMIAYTTSSYNTGWMPGDIKLATLSDTKNETVGVDESTELLVDNSNNWVGDFDVASDLDSWTESNGGIKSLNGSVIKVVSGTSGDRGSVWSMIDTIPGKKYSVSAQLVTAAGNGSGFISVYEGNGISGSEITTTYPNTFASGSYIYLQFTAQSEQSTIRLSGSEVLNDFTEWDNISVKQTGELITNGTFDDGTTGWTEGTGATISVDSATTSLKVEQGTSDFVACSQPINTIAGKKYTISFDLLSDGNSSVSAGIYVRSSQFSGGSNIISAVSNGAFGSQSATFTATGTVVYIEPGMLSSDDNIYGLFDNISVRLAENDRSVNDNGLQIFGQIDKTPVAPGADLVAYSGFSENNYLMQPYNSDLDFGTGDFCVMGWVKPNFNSTDGIFARGTEASTDNFIYLGTNSNGTIATYIDNVSGTTTSTLVENVWSFIVFGRTSNASFLYINGNKDALSYSSIEDISSTTAITRLGNTTYSLGAPNGGSLALWRVTATAPTPEQIAKIYRDEKPLFQDGAQATLYGTSDAVTALAYDDSDDLLHVGTASGRSVFNGLKRVDNTTTAVTTAISATEGLVIEQ